MEGERERIERDRVLLETIATNINQNIRKSRARFTILVVWIMWHMFGCFHWIGFFLLRFLLFSCHLLPIVIEWTGATVDCQRAMCFMLPFLLDIAVCCVCVCTWCLLPGFWLLFLPRAVYIASLLSHSQRNTFFLHVPLIIWPALCVPLDAVTAADACVVCSSLLLFVCAQNNNYVGWNSAPQWQSREDAYTYFMKIWKLSISSPPRNLSLSVPLSVPLSVNANSG